MWTHLRSPTTESVPGVATPGTNNRNPINNDAHPRQEDDATINPRPRTRRRAEPSAGPPPCCDCTRTATCSQHYNTRCPCAKAKRACTNCCPGKKCANHNPASGTPGDGWSNTIPPPSTPTQPLNRAEGSTTPPTVPVTPAPEDGAPPAPPNASLGEEDEPATDEPAAESNSEAQDPSTGQGDADAAPATDGHTAMPEGDGGN